MGPPAAENAQSKHLQPRPLEAKIVTDGVAIEVLWRPVGSEGLSGAKLLLRHW